MSALELTATPAATGLLPLTIGGMTLTETMGTLTSVAPLKGKEAAVKKALGGWPEPGKADGNILWSGRGQAFVIGEAPSQIKGAAVTDQSDAWAQLTLEGPALEDVLARLCPLDLAQMLPGSTARSLLGHMNALFWRLSEREMTIMVFRSMAATAVHELEEAMKSVQARA